ncbi:MAG TPA: hypothetical protein VN657_00925 [Nitrospiraceae bacterium]|nr:hypothetical protein [Nitrospiraceae bacterium]
MSGIMLSDGRLSRVTHNFPDTIDLTISTIGRQTGDPAVVGGYVWPAMAGRRIKQGRPST